MDEQNLKRPSTACRPAAREPWVYEIRVQGWLAFHWAECFEGLSMAHDEHGNTILWGPVADQAALHGLLATVRDLGLPLLSLNRIE